MERTASVTSRVTRTFRQIIACIGLVATAMVAQLQPAQAWQFFPIRAPKVPANLQVPEGNIAFLVGHATGTQDYICLPTATGFAWTFFGPQATLLNDDTRQIITHFLSPNPFENGTPRATWQHSRDTSVVWAKMTAASSDPAFVASGAIPWFLLQVVGAQPGPTDGHTLTPTTYIQRVHTFGGVAPATGCAQAADVGGKALVPYMADYFFYQASRF